MRHRHVDMLHVCPRGRRSDPSNSESAKNQHGCDNYYWSRDESTTQIAHKSTLGFKSTPDLDGGPTSRRYRRTGVTQTRALTKVATLTWGASFARARPVYCAVVRPAITYGSNSPCKKKSRGKITPTREPIYRSRSTRNPPPRKIQQASHFPERVPASVQRKEYVPKPVKQSSTPPPDCSQKATFPQQSGSSGPTLIRIILTPPSPTCGPHFGLTSLPPPQKNSSRSQLPHPPPKNRQNSSTLFEQPPKRPRCQQNYPATGGGGGGYAGLNTHTAHFVALQNARRETAPGGAPSLEPFFFF